jgi:hypothetical protein
MEVFRQLWKFVVHRSALLAVLEALNAERDNSRFLHKKYHLLLLLLFYLLYPSVF